MQSTSVRLIVISLAIGTATVATAQERKLGRSQLPSAVVVTVDKETKGATIKGYATETEHGKKVYEAETIVDGHTRDLQISSEGTLLEVEEEVPLASLPASVSQALTARAKGATIVKVESLRKGGQLVAYEASTENKGHKGEVQVGPAGEKLPHEQ
jgi:hypothetical protein